MTLSQKIKIFRHKKKLTQQAVAKILKIDSTTLSKIETGKLKPGGKTLKKFCNFGIITKNDILKNL